MLIEQWKRIAAMGPTELVAWIQAWSAVAAAVSTLALLGWAVYEFTIRRRDAESAVRQAIMEGIKYAIAAADLVEELANDFEGVRAERNRRNLIEGLNDAFGLLQTIQILEVRPLQLIGALIRGRNATRHLLEFSQRLLQPEEHYSRVSAANLEVLAKLCRQQLHVLREVRRSFETGVEVNTPPPKLSAASINPVRSAPSPSV